MSDEPGGTSENLPPRGEPGVPPRGPVLDHYLFEKARSLQQGGHYALAEECYRQLLERNPRSFKTLNNLGVLFESQGRMVEAEWAYRRALELEPRSARLHFNLGHALQVDGRADQAEQAYRRVIELEPDSFAAHFNLGQLLQSHDRHGEAEVCYRRAIAIDGASTAAHSSLGDMLYAQGRLGEALFCFMGAVESDPEAASEHFNLGKVLEGMGKVEEAAKCYARSLDLEPDSTVVRENFVHVLVRLGREDAARRMLEQWLEVEPGHAIATHLLAALGGGPVPERASESYVRETFDLFADQFDETLARLDYRAPELIAGALRDALGAPAADRDLLDAGCGTGLCGPALRPHARRLVGVDLSGRMIARARARDAYDELVEGDLVTFMERHAASFDAIVAADALCYFGGLEDVFAAAAKALTPGGVFAFTLERLGSDPPSVPHRLLATGRYAHAEGYVGEALAVAGFALEATTVAELRREGGSPVVGSLFRARRSPIAGASPAP